jgi:hypothetical protein
LAGCAKNLNQDHLVCGQFLCDILIMVHVTKTLYVVLLAAFAAGTPSLKATLVIGPGDFTTDGVGFNNLTSLTGSAGVLTDLTFTSSTSAANADTDYYHSTLSQEVSSSMSVEALLDQSPYTGALNPGTATTFQFGAIVPQNATLFVFGRGNDWPTSAIATDISGADLDLTLALPGTGGTFALTVTGAPWSRSSGGDFGSNLAGWSFELGELTGTGNLSDVAGVRFDRGNDNFDPTLVGYGVIPEPSSAALMLLFAGMLLQRIRRNLNQLAR